MLAIQLALFFVSGLLAFLLRFDFTLPQTYLPHLRTALGVWIIAKLLVFCALRLDHGWWRYVSLQDLARLGVGNLLGASLGALGILLLAPPGFPRSIYALDLLICFLLTAGLRVAARLVAEAARLRPTSTERKRTLIYGAGDAGISLLRELRQNPSLPYDVVGLIDDNPSKHGLSIQGARVLGGGPMLGLVAKRLAVESALIAIPTASGPQMTRILDYCHQAGLTYKTVPSLGKIVEGSALATQIRDVALDDLLGRSPLLLDQSALRRKLQGRVVLVTGAAGSIGAELCRQIARFQPAAIVAFEIAETALFYLEREMCQAFPAVPFHAEIGSIQNPSRLHEVFRLHRPAIVYHAAAYKHVPMMEAHVFEALENNVCGTWNTALAAADHGAADFVLISSDKAVRPANIMGATKRLAELLVLSLQNNHELQATGYEPRTKFVSVRFGNVLGSSGSVIPIFKQQIAAGGPLTVTHPEMRRFFMTIPEACLLVLQASTMGHGGEIFVLDMGQPVRILDLARNLILLSGLRPDLDIPIEFTGPRPGEKLYEELSTVLEDTLPTSHEKIKIFAGNGLPPQRMSAHLAALREICAARDLPQLLLTLKDIIPDYNPSSHLLRRVLATRPGHALAASA
jgi:FlaA1/EpsC-like NDP-sugar epimerase